MSILNIFLRHCVWFPHMRTDVFLGTHFPRMDLSARQSAILAPVLYVKRDLNKYRYHDEVYFRYDTIATVGFRDHNIRTGSCSDPCRLLGLVRLPFKEGSLSSK